MEGKKIFLKGEDKTKSILECKRVGDKYEVTFNNGKLFRYNASNVRIVESALNTPKSRECFDYLKSIATEVGLKVKIDDEKTINVLEHNYSKINFVMPESMLGAFLSGELPKSESEKIADIIYPFGFNGSQKEAVDKALANKLGIIEGPPGTGKTQTILNLIANAIMRDQNVAVVSSNNSATKNILDKLKAYQVDFIVAYLGNTTNKNDFIDSQQPLPDMKDWQLDLEETTILGQELIQRYGELEKRLVQKNQLSSLKQELLAVETEEKHFADYFKRAEKSIAPEIVQDTDTSEKALGMWLSCETFKEKPQSGWLMAIVYFVIDYLFFWNRNDRVVKNLLKEYSRDILIVAFQRRFYEQKILELTKSISALTNELAQFNFDLKMREGPFRRHRLQFILET